MPLDRTSLCALGKTGTMILAGPAMVVLVLVEPWASWVPAAALSLLLLLNPRGWFTAEPEPGEPVREQHALRLRFSAGFGAACALVLVMALSGDFQPYGMLPLSMVLGVVLSTLGAGLPGFLAAVVLLPGEAVHAVRFLGRLVRSVHARNLDSCSAQPRYADPAARRGLRATRATEAG